MRDLKLSILFVCRLIGVFRVARWLTRNRLKILCYHGFALGDEAEFRPKLFIKRARFEQRLATLKAQGFQVLPLDEAIERLYSRSLPDDAVVITIDDGFHSVYRLAAPTLRAYGFPATIYVTTYYVDTPNPVFRLVVQYMFWRARRRELVLQGVPWCADKTVDLSYAESAEKAMWEFIAHGEQHCTEPQRKAMCEELGNLLGTSYDEIARTRPMSLMSPNELRELADAKLSVELHTHRHTFPQDAQDIAEREIADNRKALSQWFAGEKRHFCYPSGLFHERQHAWLDQMGVKSSVTCLPGLNSDTTPRHALRRFLDGENIHRLEFEAALSGLTDLVGKWRGR